MPELPDITLYCEALEQRVLGRRLERARINSPFLLRSVEPRPDAVVGASVAAIARIGKRIAIGFDNDHWLVFHLMIAGRLHWRDSPPRLGIFPAPIGRPFDRGCRARQEWRPSATRR